MKSLDDYEDDDAEAPVKNELLTKQDLELLNRVEVLEKKVAHLAGLVSRLLEEDEEYTIAQTEF